MKQGEENSKFVKESDDDTSKFIFQKNKKTKIGAAIIITLLAIIIVAIAVSLFYFQNPT